VIRYALSVSAPVAALSGTILSLTLGRAAVSTVRCSFCL